MNGTHLSLQRKHSAAIVKKSFFVFILSLFFSANENLFAQNFGPFPSVKTGAEQTEIYLPKLKDKKIALVVNATSYISITHLVDSLLSLSVNVKKIFAPEHGFRGTADAGDEIENSLDAKSGLPIISLYGNHKKPTADDLQDIDLVVYDIQDVGVRFYTYISTLQYVMETCAENKKPLLIFDRPNPNGWYIDGPVLEKSFQSFVGMQSIPVVYAMTAGEYAQMLNGEKWLSDSVHCELEVIPCTGYEHSTKYVLPRKPSPNLTDMTAVYLYPSVCFFEGTKVSLGRGTDKPFEMIGYPDCKIGKVNFTPVMKPGATNPQYLNQKCIGFDLSIYHEGYFFEQKHLFLHWLIEFYQTYPDKENFFTPYFDKLAGTELLRLDIVKGNSIVQMQNEWAPAIEQFKLIRKKYLLYKDF